jgi:hypothetical protein
MVKQYVSFLCLHIWLVSYITVLQYVANYSIFTSGHGGVEEKNKHI